jgi:hypothetical protein
MPARRNYADAWRDSCATLAQIPVAGLLASNDFYRRWVEVSSTYLSHVSTRVALARPAAVADGTPDKSVMVDVLSEDLVDATRAFVRDVVSLPGQTAKSFNQHLEDMVREILALVQPDAKTDPRTYVVNELKKLNRELSRLREVLGAETAHRHISGTAALQADPESSRSIARATGALQANLNAVVKKFPPKAPGELKKKSAVLRASDFATRALLAIRRAQDEVGGVRQEIRDELKRATKPRARRHVSRPRRK